MKTTMKTRGKYVLTAFISLFLISFAMAQNVKVQKETEAFNVLEIFDNMSITIGQGEKPMLIVEGDSVAVAAFTPEVKNNTLIIRTDDNIALLSKVHVVVSDLKEIKLKGASGLKSTDKLKCTTLKLTASDAASLKLDMEADELSTLVEGAAAIKYTGKAKVHNIKIKGAASIKAYDLETENTSVDLSGAGSAQVNVKNELSGDISGLGTILYKEAPVSLKVTTTGLGTVKQGNSKVVVKSEVEREMDGMAKDMEEDMKDLEEDMKEVEKEMAEIADTTKFNLGKKEVQILNKKDDGKKKKKDKFNGHWGGIELGVNNYLDRYHKMEVPTAYNFLDLNTSKSISVGINLYEQNFKLYKDRFGIVSGIGLTYNNYRFVTNTVLTPKIPDVAAVVDTVLDFTKNKLTVSYLSVPLIFEVNSGKNNRFHIGAGVIGNLRIGAHTKQVYEINGSKNKDKTFDDFNLHPFRAEATVRIGFGIVNLFANYSLTPLFKTGKSPELYPFTVGLRVIGW